MEMEKVNFTTQTNEKSKNVTEVPFTVIYHALIKNLNNIINKKKYLLYLNGEVKKDFPTRTMILFCRWRTFSRYLMRRKHCLFGSVVGSCWCASDRSLLFSNIIEADEFVISVNHEAYKINHKLDYNKKWVMCLLTCNIGSKQFVGGRWNN